MGKRRKVKVEFDEQSRREYLLGFHKRKDVRRKVAKQKLFEKIQEQRRAIRDQKRVENGGHGYVFPSHVEDLQSDVTKETIDLPTHSVTVTSLENLELAQKDLYLGKNLGVEVVPVENEDPNPVEPVKGKSGKGKHFRKYSLPAVADPKKLKSLEKMFKKVKGVKRGKKNPHYKPVAKASKGGKGK